MQYISLIFELLPILVIVSVGENINISTMKAPGCTYLVTKNIGNLQFPLKHAVGRVYKGNSK